MAKFIFMSFTFNMGSNISFTHNIRPLYSADFHRITAGFGKKNFVDYPWTMAESVVGDNLYTTRVCDCTACLITDGEKAMLLHLCPSNKSNLIFNDLLSFISKNIDIMAKDKVQALMLGSKDTVASKNLWNNFSKIFKIFEIPVTKLRNGKWGTNLAYRQSTDEVLISSYPMDLQIRKGKSSGMELLNSHFKDVSISEYDEVVV